MRYPNYKVNIFGAGNSPDGSEKTLGKCSQIACFAHENLLSMKNEPTKLIPSSESLLDNEVIFPIRKIEYERLFKYDYPFYVEKRTRADVIMDDAKYFINRNLREDGKYFNSELEHFKIPFNEIFCSIPEVDDESEVRTILRKEFNIDNNDCVVISSELNYSTDEESAPKEDAESVENPIENYVADDSDWS